MPCGLIVPPLEVTVPVLFLFEREKMEILLEDEGGRDRVGVSSVVGEDGERKTRLRLRKDVGERDMREVRLELARIVDGASVS